MVIDTSAIVAIFLQEPEAASFARAIAEAEQPSLSAASLIEASIVLRRHKRVSPDDAEAWLDAFIAKAGAVVHPVTLDQSRIARWALARYGKGTGHPAQLNFGDAFAYALARALDEPLLFKGDDFTQTDVRPAL